MPSASQNYKKYSVGLIRVDLELETILLRDAEDKLLHICRWSNDIKNCMTNYSTAKNILLKHCQISLLFRK